VHHEIKNQGVHFAALKMRLTTAPSLTLLDLLAPGYPGLLPACGAPLYVRFGLIATEFARRGKLSRVP
jgi:hypothetical protein